MIENKQETSVILITDTQLFVYTDPDVMDKRDVMSEKMNKDQRHIQFFQSGPNNKNIKATMPCNIY